MKSVINLGAGVLEVPVVEQNESLTNPK